MTTHELIVVKTLNKTAQNQHYHGRSNGTYLQLAPGILAPTSTYNQLSHWEQHKLRALALGTSHVRILGGISAATLWNMWTYYTPESNVEYYVYQGKRSKYHPGKQLNGYLPKSSITRGSMVHTTSIARTIIDLARYHGYEHCYMALTWALRNNQCRPEDILSALKPSLGATDTIHHILNHADPTVESAPEAYFLAQSHHHGDFSLIPQEPIVDTMHTLRRADFRIRGTRCLVEISGMGKFGTSDTERSQNFRRETERNYALNNAGYQILSYTASEVFSGHAYRHVLRFLNTPTY